MMPNGDQGYANVEAQGGVGSIAGNEWWDEARAEAVLFPKAHFTECSQCPATEFQGAFCTRALHPRFALAHKSLVLQASTWQTPRNHCKSAGPRRCRESAGLTDTSECVCACLYVETVPFR